MRTNRPKALLRADLPDPFTHGLYRLAPYRGCAHGCRYCDGRAERYYVLGDFEKDIIIRKDIPEALAEELPRMREEGMVVFGSGTTDPYQPCELVEDISGRAARLLATPPAGTPRLSASVLTKASLAERDIEAWAGVNSKSGFLILASITSLDESLRELMEPGSAPFAERFRMLKRFKEAGCATGILAMPLLPGLSDSRQSIASLYEAAVEAGVDFLMPGGLTLRPGRQKELYIKTLAAARPELLDFTLELFREERPSGAPSRSYRKGLEALAIGVANEYDLPFLLPHRVHAGLLPAHDSFRVLLRDMVELYRLKGIGTRPLEAAADRYDAWLVGLRRYFRRQRSLPSSWLPERFESAVADDELDRVLDNPRLSAFARAVLVEGAILDYRNLRLG
ncbi:MAG TPA: radical SAM protein [Rectinemataceae bacterium]|nr:radical SAM protein [Rectinemataceae bacterium]